MCLYHTFLAEFGFCFPSVFAADLFLFCAPGNASLGQVINRNLNGYAVTGQNFDIVHTKLAGNMCRHDVTVGQLHLEARVGQRLNDRTFKFNDIFLLCQKNPS